MACGCSICDTAVVSATALLLMMCSFAGQASVDLSTSFLQASLNQLSLSDLASLYNTFAPRNYRVPLSDIPISMSIKNVDIMWAPRYVLPPP